MLFREEDEDLEVLPFADRGEAGRILAGKLSAYSGRNGVIVLGIPRGGVVVASAVAGALHLPLDVFVLSKLGSPWSKELAMGALTEDGVRVLDLSIVSAMCVSDEDVREVVSNAQKQIDFRRRLYRGGRIAANLEGKTAILVDDGIATGCSILAAVGAIRRKGAVRVVVAVPVAPAQGCNAIRMEADELVSVAAPEMFLAVSQWYEEFPQVNDEEVCRLLKTTDNWTSHAA